MGDLTGDAAVVVLVLDADAAARVLDAQGHEGVIVSIFVVVGVDDLAAGGLLRREVVAKERSCQPLFATNSGRKPRARRMVAQSLHDNLPPAMGDPDKNG
jgi:hypothetical protein